MSLLAGAAISAGASLVGGAMNRRAQKKANRQAQYQFDQQMDYSIQRRVADAKKAGIHPLYALGASPGASPTIMAGQHDSGSAISDAGAAIGSGLAAHARNKQEMRAAELERIRLLELNAAQIQAQKASANADNALAMQRLSDMKRAEQATNYMRKAPDPNAIPETKLHDPGKKGSLTTPYGGTLHQRSKRSWADDWSARYGEPGEWIGGILGLLQDVGSYVGNWQADRVEDYQRKYGIKKPW